MKQKIEQLKSHIGKEVFLVGTGNNARRTDKFRKDVIESVGRVQVVLHVHGVLRVSEWDELHVEDKHNGGFLVFFTEKEVQDHVERMELSSKLNSRLYCRRRFQDLSLDQLRQIKAIVDGGGE